jgi:RNA polymerase sigma-70 factor (ECF subfamily)
MRHSAQPGLSEGHSLDEAALLDHIRAIAGGDEAAFAAFYDATVGLVYGLALRILRDASEAEEVVSDVYLQVWRQAARFDAARGVARAWLVTIARSRALDTLRKRDPAEPREDAGALDDLAVSNTPDPPDWLSAVERGQTLHAALARLSPEQRQMLALAYFRGLSHQEICDHTGIPLGTVKTHLRKALDALRVILHPLETMQ